MTQPALSVNIVRLHPEKLDIPLPVYATEGSSGMDIHAAVEHEVILQPGSTGLIPTGFTIEIPSGFEAQIRPRSGLAIKHNIGILNSPGTIDADYRGEVKIILTNFGTTPFPVRRGDRIAQMVICPVVRIVWNEVQSIQKTDRGAGGFGHTGT